MQIFYIFFLSFILAVLYPFIPYTRVLEEPAQLRGTTFLRLRHRVPQASRAAPCPIQDAIYQLPHNCRKLLFNTIPSALDDLPLKPRNL